MEHVEMQFVEGDRKLSCRLYKKESKYLLVFFSALRPKASKLTILYNRITWVDLFLYNCLFIADPTMLYHPELRGGYYQGSKNWYGIEYCVDVILKIAAMLNIIEKNILLYGSSQGGFAALAAHAFMNKANVLAESPQSDLSVLTSAKADRLKMLKNVYHTDTFESLNSEFRARTNILKLYDIYPPVLKNINVIVKETDLIHLSDHIYPLLLVYSQLQLEVIKGEMGLGGHSAVDRSIIKNKVVSILES